MSGRPQVSINADSASNVKATVTNNQISPNGVTNIPFTACDGPVATP